MDVTLRQVVVENLGSGLIADAASGATTVTVQDPADFAEQGGQLSRNGVEYEYVAANQTTGVITLATPLLSAALADDVVFVLSVGSAVAQEWSIEFEALAGEELDRATIPLALIPYFIPGDAQAGATVSVGDDGRRGNIVLSRPGEAGGLDLGFADPTTVPDRVPTAVPTEALTLTVVGDDTFITAVAQGDVIAPTTSLAWYIDGALVEVTRSPTYRFAYDSTGTRLVAGASYAITVQPVNVVGVGTTSAPAAGALNPALSSGGVRDLLVTGPTLSNVRILGAANMVEGTMTLSKGVSAPTLAPTLAKSWTHAAAFTTLDKSSRASWRRGLALSGGNWYSGHTALSGDVGVGQYSAAGTSVTGAGTPPVFAPNLQPLGGLTLLGTTWYVLVRDTNRSFQWWVRTYDTSWNYLTEWQFTRSATDGYPAITNDGTSLWIARPTGTGRIEISKWSTAGVDQLTIVQTATGIVGSDQVLTGLYVGNADLGALRYIVTSYGTVFVLNSTGTRQTAEEWASPNGESMFGLHWDGTRFHTVSLSGRIWHSSTLVADTARSVTHTRYSAAGPYETPPSPAATMTQKRREWLSVTVDSASPNGSGIYVANQRQGYLAPGTTSVVYDAPTTGGAAAPTTNGFTAVSAPGKYVSEATDADGPIESVGGDGPGRVGPLKWNGAGETLKSPTKANKVTITTGAAGTVTSQAVTFAVPFAAGVVPKVVTDVVTSRPDLNSSSHGTATNTGFTLYLTRSAASATLDVDWAASVPE